MRCLPFLKLSAGITALFLLVGSHDTGNASPAQPFETALRARYSAQPLSKTDNLGNGTLKKSQPIVASLIDRNPAEDNSSSLEQIVVLRRGNRPTLTSLPSFTTEAGGKQAAVDQSGNYVYFTTDPALQSFAQRTVKAIRAPHAAVVVMQPSTGKILAIAGKSENISSLPLHSFFPAASLFKIVTASSAVERSTLTPDTRVFFRGGTYTLNEWNYLPNPKKDLRSFTASEAMGKSCNPVFGRIATLYSSPEALSSTCRSFGFNASLGFDIPLAQSRAEIPYSPLEFSRTGAGFGAVTISPVHAAAIAAGLGNRGLMTRPVLIDSMVDQKGQTVYQAEPTIVNRMVSPVTAGELLKMMEYTTTMGTSKGAFTRGRTPQLGSIRVAAKTGTLRGQNPEGITNWFIATAPIENPQVALATVVMDPGGASAKASHLGRLMFQKYFGFEITEKPASQSKKGYRSSGTAKRKAAVSTPKKKIKPAAKKKKRKGAK